MGGLQRNCLPVLKLSRGMKRLSGELNIHVDTKRKDEFGFLIQSFNKMAVVQKHLIEDHYERTAINDDRVEVSAIPDQPAFSIQYPRFDLLDGQNYDADEISEMVMNLSKFFG